MKKVTNLNNFLTTPECPEKGTEKGKYRNGKYICWEIEKWKMEKYIHTSICIVTNIK